VPAEKVGDGVVVGGAKLVTGLLEDVTEVGADR
jgi:hypothetical protein